MGNIIDKSFTYWEAIDVPSNDAVEFELMISWIASDKSTRIPISTFQLALELHGVEVDVEEVECMLANMVFRVSRTSSSSCSKGRLDYHAYWH